MRPEERSRRLLAITRAKAKMYEYGVPEVHHIHIPRDPARLMRLAVGALGDEAAAVASQRRGDNDQRDPGTHFSARYFDAFVGARLDPGKDAYLTLLSAAAYYLAELPGSASVLIERLPSEMPDLGAGGIEQCLAWLLRRDVFHGAPEFKGDFSEVLSLIAMALSDFYATGTGKDFLLKLTRDLRDRAYSEGTPRQLLMADACAAIARRRHQNSSWNCLPAYTGQSAETWAPALRKGTFPLELWPGQRMLGERGVFRGKSAIVHMPTSAGKTRATEIIIRSAFLGSRATLAVVVAPFRALCHEIHDSLALAFQGEAIAVQELSDVFQTDFDINAILGQRTVIVVTPEKLLYALRQAEGLAAEIGLLILDEAHQFDNGARGVAYELLVTSLKALIPDGAQKVMVSAVLSNGAVIGAWLNGPEPNVIAGPHLVPTERSVALTSWLEHQGRLEFVAPDDPDQQEFFVPRVIGTVTFSKRRLERVARVFPARDSPTAIGLFLGLKLVGQGSVAIFCGQKSTATTVCKLLLDVATRGLNVSAPSLSSNPLELQRLVNLHTKNLGNSATATQAARLGVLTHHGNTAHGIRLAVEHAMKESLAKFVVCTSTLAQGVNLPIRYLIVTTTQQGSERIKVRDFQNLIGRAGRSGMHTEGSVIFANPNVYDHRTTLPAQWEGFKKLMQVGNSEPCASTLLESVRPLASDGGRVALHIDPIAVARVYVADVQGDGAWVDSQARLLKRPWFSKERLALQLAMRRDVFSAIESFLLAYWDGSASSATDLCSQTLAYHLATPKERAALLALFELLATNIGSRVAEPLRRASLGRTLFGVGQGLAVEAWVHTNLNAISQATTDTEILAAVWQCLTTHVENSTFRKLRPASALLTFAQGWLAGRSFGQLSHTLTTGKVRLGHGKRPRKPTIEATVELGENGFGFDAALVVGAIIEVCISIEAVDGDLTARLQGFQKRLKHGLPTQGSVVLFEAGFADRVVAQELAALMPADVDRDALRRLLRGGAVAAAMEPFPAYFHRVRQRLMA